MVSAVPLLRFYMISGFSNEACFNIVVAVDTRSGGDYLLAELEDEGREILLKGSLKHDMWKRGEGKAGGDGGGEGLLIRFLLIS
jgi:hypothetical protein